MSIEPVEQGLHAMWAVVALRGPLLGLTLLVAGCAMPPRGPVPLDRNPASACLALFKYTDATLAAAGVADGAAARIDGFPWLRVNRPLASFRHEAASAAQFAAWVSGLAALDQAGRFHELRNLPASDRQRLRDNWQAAATAHRLPAMPLRAMAACRTRLAAQLAQDPGAQEQLRRAAIAPDHYVDWQRFLGLYPLSSRIARHRVVKLHQRLATRLAASAVDSDTEQQYAVRVARNATPGQIRSLLQQMDRDALGIPRPKPRTANLLLSAHAPLWSVATESEADQPGALVLSDGERPVVDITRPTEYRWWSWTRFGDEALLQLNYALWFPERPPSSVFDVVAGHLDGIIWRVTLQPDGAVLAYESVHTCGCYYTLLPNPDWAVARQPPDEEPVFSPMPAPSLAPHERVRVRRESGTHYLAGVTPAVAPAGNTRALAVLPMDTLRSLPVDQGRFASVYGPRGLIAASRRCERFLLWPLGVPSAGASRQPGTHAIAFVGKRHFDDPRLLDNLLVPTTEVR